MASRCIREILRIGNQTVEERFPLFHDNPFLESFAAEECTLIDDNVDFSYLLLNIILIIEQSRTEKVSLSNKVANRYSL